MWWWQLIVRPSMSTSMAPQTTTSTIQPVVYNDGHPHLLGSQLGTVRMEWWRRCSMAWQWSSTQPVGWRHRTAVTSTTWVSSGMVRLSGQGGCTYLVSSIPNINHLCQIPLEVYDNWIWCSDILWAKTLWGCSDRPPGNLLAMLTISLNGPNRPGGGMWEGCDTLSAPSPQCWSGTISRCQGLSTISRIGRNSAWRGHLLDTLLSTQKLYLKTVGMPKNCCQGCWEYRRPIGYNGRGQALTPCIGSGWTEGTGTGNREERLSWFQTGDTGWSTRVFIQDKTGGSIYSDK